MTEKFIFHDMALTTASFAKYTKRTLFTNKTLLKMMMDTLNRASNSNNSID